MFKRFGSKRERRPAGKTDVWVDAVTGTGYVCRRDSSAGITPMLGACAMLTVTADRINNRRDDGIDKFSK